MSELDQHVVEENKEVEEGRSCRPSHRPLLYWEFALRGGRHVSGGTSQNRSARRLTKTIDRKNTHSWRGDTKVANADITKCWNEGKTLDVAKLTESRIFQDDPTELDISQIMSNGSGINMLRPYCIERSVGVLAGDQAIYDLGDLELDDEDDE